MHRITDVRPLEGFQIWIKFSDGAEGVIDLSGFAGRGVFSIWEDLSVFQAVFVDPVSHTVAWPGGIDLCPDSLYVEITGLDIFSKKTTYA